MVVALPDTVLLLTLSLTLIPWSVVSPVADSSDSTPPECSAILTTMRDPNFEIVIFGSTQDYGAGNSGLASVVLDPSATGVNCPQCPINYSPPNNLVGRGSTIGLTPPATSGRGTVIATDGVGQTCSVAADFREVPGGQLEGQNLFEDLVHGIRPTVKRAQRIGSLTCASGSGKVYSVNLFSSSDRVAGDSSCGGGVGGA